MQLDKSVVGTRSRGFTLLEVLVAMVVLSIGLLGLSGMQTTSLRNNHSAFLRSQATVVTNDILDRMRANRDSATAGDYDIAYGATAPTPGCSGGSGCSVIDVANRNVAEWLAYVQRLPDGEGRISVDAAGVAEVRVCWNDTRGSDAALALPCANPQTAKTILLARSQI